MRIGKMVLLIMLAFTAGVAMAKLGNGINIDMLRNAGKLLGFSFADEQYEYMMPSVRVHMQSAEALREAGLDNHVPPAWSFSPLIGEYEIPEQEGPAAWVIPDDVRMPDKIDELAFYSIPELASLIHSMQISSEELTLFFLNRLKQYNDTLESVVTYTRDRALESARRADAELAEGKSRGILHGIPFGVKDLLAVSDYPTTWGAMPYRDQYIDHTASVVSQLDEAGAVLVAKMSLGALAMGDVWFDGNTRNPWNLEQGSSGSSAGSAAAVSAGLLPFALGSETLGSIVSPATRCGVTGLRPSWGRISRDGAMALSWTMDKLGPLARSAGDAAIVFDAIHGPDGLDNSLIEAGFSFDPEVNLEELRVGYIEAFFQDDYTGKGNDSQVLEDLQSMGVELIPVEWRFNLPVNALRIILHAEAAAAFDELTTKGLDSLLVNQDIHAWPNFFRAARFIPAVEYINANRVRHKLTREVNELMKHYDVIITPTFGGNQLLVTNLTGHPCVVMPNGMSDAGTPTSISFIGPLFNEDKLLALAAKWQEYSEHHLERPPFFDPAGNEY